MSAFKRKLLIGNGAAVYSIILMFVSIVTTLLGLITTKLLSVNFTLQEYGTYSQALLVSTTAASLTLLGLSSAINFFYNKTNDNVAKQEFVSTIFVIEELIGTVVAVALILFRNTIAEYFDNIAVEKLIVIVAFMPLLTNMIALYQNLFVSIGRAKTIAIRNLIVSVCRLLSVIIASFITHNVRIILIVLLFLDVFQLLYFAYVFKRNSFRIGIGFFSTASLKTILEFSIPLSIYSITGSLANDLDKYVIGYFADTDTLAIYTNASKRLPFDVVTNSFITILIPIITRLLNGQDKTGAKKLFCLYLRLGIIISLICGGGCLFLSKPLMVLLYDEKYVKGLLIFAIYIVIEMVKFANVTIVLSATGQTKLMMGTSVLMLISNGFFNILSYKILGWYGPAITTLVLTIVVTIVLLYFAAKTLETRVIDLFDIREFLIVFIEAIMVGSCFAYLYHEMTMSFDVPQLLVLPVLAIFGLIMAGLNKKRLKAYIHQINAYK